MANAPFSFLGSLNGDQKTSQSYQDMCTCMFFFASGRSTVSICQREGKKNTVDLRRKGKLNSEEVGKVGGEG